MVEDTSSQSSTIWATNQLIVLRLAFLKLTMRISALAKLINDQQAPICGQVQRYRYLLQINHECTLVLIQVSSHSRRLPNTTLTLDTLSRVATRVMILSVRPMSALVAGTKLPT